MNHSAPLKPLITVSSAKQKALGLRACWALLWALVILPACGGENHPGGSGRASAADTSSWTLSAEPRARIGSADGPPSQSLDRVYGGLVAPDGRILLANSGTAELRFFDPRGRFLFASGRRGSGPGEFQGINWMGLTRGDSILLYDMRQRRFSVLDGTGRFGRSFALPPSVGAAQPAGTLADGTILLAAQEPYDPRVQVGVVRDRLVLLRATATGEVTGPLASVPGAEWLLYSHPSSYRATQLPFGRTGHVVAAGEHVVYASSDAAELSVYDRAGSLVRKIGFEAESRPLTGAEVSGYLDATITDAAEKAAIQGYMDSDAERRTAPLISALRGDRAGNVWVQLFPPAGRDTTKWVVVSPAGTRIGSLRLAATDLPLDMHASAVLVREWDADRVERVALRALSR